MNIKAFVDHYGMLAEAISFTAIMLFTNAAAYKNGVCDGAFNHFLSDVRETMKRYDQHRADEILKAEEEKYGITYDNA